MFFPMSCRETGPSHTRLTSRAPAHTLLLSTGAPSTCRAASRRKAPASATTCSTGAMLADPAPNAHVHGGGAHHYFPFRASRSGEERLRFSSAAWRPHPHPPTQDYPRARATTPAAQPRDAGTVKPWGTSKEIRFSIHSLAPFPLLSVKVVYILIVESVNTHNPI